MWTGFDVLAHAIESLTALPFAQRSAPENPGLRPAYQGSNPISDIWAAKAIDMVSRNMMRVLQDPEDEDARGQMLLGASFAGIGFGNAGVHLVHGTVLVDVDAGAMARYLVPGKAKERRRGHRSPADRVVTLAGLLFTPIFYVTVRWLARLRGGRETTADQA